MTCGILCPRLGSERAYSAGQGGPGDVQDPQPPTPRHRKGGATVRGSLSLGRILGIPIRLHFSWFLIAALVTLA